MPVLCNPVPSSGDINRLMMIMTMMIARRSEMTAGHRAPPWVFECVTKNVLSRALPYFGRYVKPLFPAASAVVNTHQPALDLRGGLRPVLLMYNP
jgi:hypothetical protein